MWWSLSVPVRPLEFRRSRDQVERLLAEYDLSPTNGLWTDAGHTVGTARSPAGLFVGWIDVGWLASDDPFSELRDVAHLADDVGPEQLARELGFALAEAARTRAERLRDCNGCGERYVPGQMYDVARCHGCAPRRPGGHG